MSKLRKQLLESREEDNGPKEYTLTDYEFRYLKDMNNCLMFHTLRNQLISNFLTYVASTRLGYQSLPDDKALQYELDLRGEDHTIKITEVPKADAVASEEVED